MKKQILSILSLIFLMLFMVACDRTETLETTESAEDDAEIQALFDDVEDETETQIETVMNNMNPPNGCPTFTWASPRGTYPNTLTIDFGTACVGPNGRVRAGQIQVYMSDTFRVTNAFREISLINFSIDSVQLEGVTRLTNNGNATFTRLIIDAKITKPNGNVVRDWDATRTITQTAGTNTIAIFDDEFSITGSSTGINRNGNTFTNTITSPLLKARTCRWIKSGMIDHTVNGNTFSLDYGTGNCDRQATVTGPNGNSRNIILRR